MENLKPLSMQVFGRKNADAGHITARSVETGDQTASNRINADHEHNRDGGCRSHSRLDGNAIGDNYGHLPTYQIGRGGPAGARHRHCPNGIRSPRFGAQHILTRSSLGETHRRVVRYHFAQCS